MVCGCPGNRPRCQILRRAAAPLHAKPRPFSVCGAAGWADARHDQQRPTGAPGRLGPSGGPRRRRHGRRARTRPGARSRAVPTRRPGGPAGTGRRASRPARGGPARSGRPLDPRRHRGRRARRSRRRRTPDARRALHRRRAHARLLPPGRVHGGHRARAPAHGVLCVEGRGGGLRARTARRGPAPQCRCGGRLPELGRHRHDP